jgi:hypothetical protein
MVAGILQHRGVLVGRVPDDESDALLGGGGSEDAEKEENSGQAGGEVLEHGGSSINSGPWLRAGAEAVPPSKSPMNPG